MAGYIKITGPRSILENIHDINGLAIRPRTGKQTGPDEHLVKAYASDDAIAQLEGRGATVTVLKSSEDTQTHLASLEGYIGENNNGEIA
jgi:hypothetical protein